MRTLAAVLVFVGAAPAAEVRFARDVRPILSDACFACHGPDAKKRKAETVAVEDLRRAYAYFLDEKRSVQFLKEQQGALIFEDAEEVPGAPANGAGGEPSATAEMDTS